MAGLMIIGLASNIGTELVGLDVAKAANAVVTVAIFNAAGTYYLGNYFR